MSRRATVIVTLTAVLVAAVALVVRPLLANPTQHANRPPTPSIILTSPPGAVPLAERAARQALACPIPTPGLAASAGQHTVTTWCGLFTITRRQTTCQTAVHCVIDLVGTLHAAGEPSAVALSVTMRNLSGGWFPIEVTS